MIRIGLCEKYHWTWEQAGETPMAEVGNLFAGFEDAYHDERKAAELKVWDKLTPEEQARRRALLKQVGEMQKQSMGK